MVYETIYVPIVAGAVRAFAGWLENTLGKKYESVDVKKLLGSAARIGVLGIALGFGFDLSALAASGLAVGADITLSKLGKAE